jgi:ABC-type phosphate/phosphonate transport system substrate-binding protein
MKSILFILFLFIKIFAQEPMLGSMGVLTDGISDTKKKDNIIAFTILIYRVGYKNNMEGDLKYYDFEKNIIKDYLDNKMNYILINPYFYLKNKKILDNITAFYWSVRKYKSKFQKMVILTQKDSGIDKIDDLKNKTVIVKTDNYMGEIVLDRSILESKHISKKKYIKDMKYTTKHSTAILKTYFSKADAAIVPFYAFKLVSEMNPMVKNRLKIIYETDELFMPVISLINKSTSNQIIQTMKKTSKKLHLTKEGRNIFTLFKMTSIDELEPKDLDPLNKYYEEYINLKNKYGR